MKVLIGLVVGFFFGLGCNNLAVVRCQGALLAKMGELHAAHCALKALQKKMSLRPEFPMPHSSSAAPRSL
jgi:hypothetical protein